MITTARYPITSPLSIVAIGVAGFICLPLFYVMYLAITADPALWNRLWNTRIPELFGNTASLAAGVAVATLILGLSLAWIVVRYEFPGRRIWEWALVLPLAMPTYVLAYIYAYLMGPGGPAPLFSPQSYPGVTLVMALDTFPFVYLLARAALLNFNVSFEEVARACGATQLKTLYQVTLPLLRPAVVAGLSLVILYVVSDFGAVSLLRFQTLTYGVYQQLTGRYDHSAASVLSLLLVIFAFAFLVAERWFRHRSRFYQTTGRYRAPERLCCGPAGSAAATLYLGLVFAASFGIPIWFLLKWSGEAIAQGALDSRFVGYVWNSMLLSGLAATGAVIIGIPLAYLASRYPSRVNLLCLQAAHTGYVLPGPVAAFAVLALFAQLAPIFYGTIVVLIVAYIVHFLPAGLQSMEPAIQQVTPNLEEAARSLGLGLVQTLRKVTLPLVRTGFIVAWVLMFLQSMKELPATLLLRPVGFDTLAVRVWLEASEEYYQMAAPSALLIVIMSLPALWLLVSRDWRAA
jgi:iron(III) transport system permease protein